ncbi:SAVED domain-containing protein [Aliarcobacter cryaerophilus]|uniref:SAVED domain-containing protein n=1 Tax=Aliarcobacter cryaerophilus TaxID=28198 RepID=UPI00112F4445|nr:SAVED domain-containing protein [Aliarcobacter cryaerophilus]
MKIKNFLENKFISIVGIFAIIAGPFYDAIDNPIITWITFSFLSLIFIFAVIDEYKRNKKLNSSVIHIPIVIKVDDGPDTKYVMKDLIKKIESDYNFSDYEEILQKYYSINVNKFIFEENCNMYDFERLINFARIIKYNITQIESLLEKPVKFHIAFYRRPMVGFLIGTIFRTNNISIYQNNDSKNCFEKVANIESRKYKERINLFNKYKIVEHISDENDNTILVTIDSASHYVNKNENNLKKYSNYVNISLIENGTIPYSNDWSEYAQEIYNVLNNLQTRFKSITIAHSMPEAISIILGMALENYWEINITQYKDGSYHSIYSMNQIKYYF